MPPSPRDKPVIKIKEECLHIPELLNTPLTLRQVQRWIVKTGKGNSLVKEDRDTREKVYVLVVWEMY